MEYNANLMSELTVPKVKHQVQNVLSNDENQIIY